MIRQRIFKESLPPPVRERGDDRSLRFSPTAWAKLLFLRDAGNTEVGGFGISAADDPLYVEDVQLVRQVCTAGSVAFEDESVADFFDRQVDAGIAPARCGRLWLHTHPGNCPQPSMTDEETFARVFGRTDWAVMFILARGGESYARLRFNVGPGGSLTLPVEIDYRWAFGPSDHDAWQEEYAANVEAAQPPAVIRPELVPFGETFDDDWFSDWDPQLAEAGFLDEEDHSYVL
jgi:hypothetical protein